MNNQSINPTKGVSKLSVILIGGLSVFLVGGYFYLQGKNKEMNMATRDATAITTPKATNTVPTTTENQEAITDGEVVIFNIEAGSYYYKPNVMRVKKGDKVRIVMSVKDMTHDFNIDELHVEIPVTQAGKTGSVEFVADKVGSFEYYCGVGSHRKMGQVGTIIVE